MDIQLTFEQFAQTFRTAMKSYETVRDYGFVDFEAKEPLLAQAVLKLAFIVYMVERDNWPSARTFAMNYARAVFWQQKDRIIPNPDNWVDHGNFVRSVLSYT